MRFALIGNVVVIVSMVFCSQLQGQQDSQLESFRKSTINELSNRLIEHYVEPDLAIKTSKHLQDRLKAGFFNNVSDTRKFAEALTQELRAVTKDEHLLVRPVVRQATTRVNSTEAFLARHRDRVLRDRENAGGLRELRILENNVGYLSIQNFAQLQLGRDYADSCMKVLAGTDAIIIDLRENGGGYPEMVQYLCSYFFEERVHLNSLYWRDGDRLQEFWSIDKVGENKLPNLPLFILISGKTFSAAEEFAYNLQTQKRATLIGKTTRGGANPGRVMQLNKELEAIIPIGKAINPITKTNWEGVGVAPDVDAEPEQAFEKAYELAKIAAQKRRAALQSRFEDLSNRLVDNLTSFSQETGDRAIFETLKECKEAGLLDQRMINGIGFEYLMNFKKPKVAEAIFRTNTILFPSLASVFDSYARALETNGNLELAAKNYQQAINIAKTTSDPELHRYKSNLQRLKKK